MRATILEMAPGALSDYYDWLKASANGDTLVYWRGHLQEDRQVVIPITDVMNADKRLLISALNFVAHRVFQDAKEGHLVLTQKRIGDRLFEYRATRKRYDYSPTPVQPNVDLVLA